MSQIQVDNIYNKEATGSPSFPLGANVTGVITATSFSGSGANLTGIDATALKDSNGTVRVQANTTGAVITGNVSVGGTLTYEDVTNVDAVGVITARNGVDITGASAGVNGSSNLILKTGGTERVRINNSGQVLIGTGVNPAYPNRRLTVATDDSGGTTAIEIRSATNGDARIIFTDSTTSGDAGAYKGQIKYDQTDDHVSFYTNGNSERLRIGSAGQIGLSGANYGTSGQVMTSQGGSAAPQWATPGGTETLISSTSMNAQNNFTLTGLDFTTYPRGYRFVVNNFNIYNSSGNWTNGTSPRFRLGTSGGIMATNYGYQSIEQRSESQNLDLSSQNSQDEVRISTNAERWFVLDMTIYPADLSGSPANGSGTGNGGYPAQFSVKSKYLRPGGSNYNQLACMSLEGGMHLHGLSGSQIAQVDRIYFRAGGSNETFNGGTMRTYGLK